MAKKQTKEEFIEKANKVHHGRYDYSKTKYTKSSEKVCIICPIHGEFWQRPVDHITQRQGCMQCGINKKKKLIHGFGINDTENIPATSISYIKWYGIIKRCYSDKLHIKRPTYKGCTICDEWRYFSNFKQWFDDNYVDGYHLDKDILVKGNKVYSPETCCFVPPEINTFLTNSISKRGKYLIGVKMSNNKRRFVAQIERNNKKVGLGYFKTELEAFLCYKTAKEQYIKEVSLQYYNNGLISLKVYKALNNYEIWITD